MMQLAIDTVSVFIQCLSTIADRVDRQQYLGQYAETSSLYASRSDVLIVPTDFDIVTIEKVTKKSLPYSAKVLRSVNSIGMN